MVFSSMIFLWIFLPVTLILYYALSCIARPEGVRGAGCPDGDGCLRLGKQKMANLLLLFVSLLFYSFGEPKYVVLLLVSVAVNYAGGLAIADFTHGKKRAALAAAVAWNLGLLGYFKYYMFATGTVNSLAGSELLPVRQVALPIGISFYTFQALSYLIDLYRGNCTVQRSFYKLLLYISFFPQLIAGPIVRYRDFAGQMDNRSVDFSKFSEGAARFAAGLGKKVILANSFAPAADMVFAMEAADRGTLAAWYGVVLYGIQIYFDFSGYSDMAIGMGKMFGFDFLENFQMPYVSRSIREYWRRWHISLSTWFKEYLYIPLGGSRRGTARTCLNLFIVFLVTGLWHGAGWNFVLWGMVHGCLVIAERLFLSKWLEKQPFRIVEHLYCHFALLCAWVLFRTDTLTGAAAYWKTMFRLSAGSAGFTELFGRRLLVLSAAGVLLCGVIPEQTLERIRNANWFRGLFLPGVMLVSIALLAADSYNPFIYFRF